MRKGLSQSEIARELNVSRQAVNRIVEAIPERIVTALNEAAKINRVEPRHMDVSKGILFGWSRDFQTETVIALSHKGLQVWHQHNLGECKICPSSRECKSMLIKTAEDLEIALTREERNLKPSELSSLVFSRLPGRDNGSIDTDIASKK